jgi:hypothetical protein
VPVEHQRTRRAGGRTGEIATRVHLCAQHDEIVAVVVEHTQRETRDGARRACVGREQVQLE